MAEEKRLIGNDGSLSTVSFGSTITSAIAARSWAKIMAKATDTALNVTVASFTPGTNTLGFTAGTALSGIALGDTIKFTYNGVVYSAECGTVTTASPASIVLIGAGQIPAFTGQTITAYKSSRFGGLSVGDFFYNPKASTLTITSGDSYQLATITPMLDINGWTLKIAATEVEVSTLADKFKKYRKGKLDADGTVAFVWIKGITDQAGGLVNQFFDIASIAADGTVTFVQKSTAPLYLLGYLSEETTAGQVAEATLMQVELYDININVKDGEGSNQEPKFRLTGDSDPVVFRITVA